MKRLILACLLAVPFVGRAAIIVEAPSMDGAWAYLYNPNTGDVYSQAQFTGGSATIDVSMMVDGDAWAVDATYDPAKKWQSNAYLYFDGAYHRNIDTWFSGFDGITVGGVSGAITSRTYDPDNHTISVTYQGNTAGPLTLEGLNNDFNMLDAMLTVYRPALSDPYNPDHKTLQWDPTTLTLGYDYDVTAGYIGDFDLITVTNLAGTFSAQYLGEDLGGTYNLLFAAFDDPGDTAYWSTFDHDGTTNGVVSNGDGSVTFTSYTPNSVSLDDGVPYYVMMDYSESFVGGKNTANSYLVRGMDGGVSLTNPDYYVIPEPAVVSLIGLAGIGMLVSRRLFRG